MSRAENKLRAGWAATGLAAFQSTVNEWDCETAIVDLIADLGHLARIHKLDYLAILRRGIRAWAYEEREPNDLGQSPPVSIRIGTTRPNLRMALPAGKGGAK